MTSKRKTIYVCSCGCEILRENAIRLFDHNHHYRYCCPEHRHEGFVQHLKLTCIDCACTFSMVIKRCCPTLRCPDCKQLHAGHRSANRTFAYKPRSVPVRYYDCHYYNDCLDTSPKQPKFDCTKCESYREESFELKFRRNSTSLVHHNNRMEKQAVLFSFPGKLYNKEKK